MWVGRWARFPCHTRQKVPTYPPTNNSHAKKNAHRCLPERPHRKKKSLFPPEGHGFLGVGPNGGHPRTTQWNAKLIHNRSSHVIYRRSTHVPTHPRTPTHLLTHAPTHPSTRRDSRKPRQAARKHPHLPTHKPLSNSAPTTRRHHKPSETPRLSGKST